MLKIINKLKLKYHKFRLKQAKTIDQDYKLLVKYGYIKDDCTPIKCCNCGSTNLKETNFDYGNDNIPVGVLCEYEVICIDCGAINGHWAYGGWSL